MGPAEGTALPSHLRVGTSSFAHDDWVGPFYPDGTEPASYLGRYAERFDTVEIDATFYRIPSERQVAGWRDRTPDGFVFAAKVPQTITHEKSLLDCLDEMNRFLDVMRGLGEKLGPLLFQFPYVSKARDPEEYASGDRLRERLGALLEQLPKEVRFAVEVRNERWISEPLLDLLRYHHVALALIDYYTTPSMARIAARPEATTAEFSYVRFLGNHREMDAAVEKKAARGGRRWDEVVRDRTSEMRAWIPALRELSRRVNTVYVYFNNHYAGYAPGSIDLFRATWGTLA